MIPDGGGMPTKGKACSGGTYQRPGYVLPWVQQQRGDAHPSTKSKNVPTFGEGPSKAADIRTIAGPMPTCPETSR